MSHAPPCRGQISTIRLVFHDTVFALCWECLQGEYSAVFAHGSFLRLGRLQRGGSRNVLCGACLALCKQLHPVFGSRALPPCVGTARLVQSAGPNHPAQAGSGFINNPHRKNKAETWRFRTCFRWETGAPVGPPLHKQLGPCRGPNGTSWLELLHVFVHHPRLDGSEQQRGHHYRLSALPGAGSTGCDSALTRPPAPR